MPWCRRKGLSLLEKITQHGEEDSTKWVILSETENGNTDENAALGLVCALVTGMLSLLEHARSLRKEVGSTGDLSGNTPASQCYTKSIEWKRTIDRDSITTFHISGCSEELFSLLMGEMTLSMYICWISYIDINSLDATIFVLFRGTHGNMWLSIAFTKKNF